MEFCSSDCSGNSNGHWNINKEKRHFSTKYSDNWMNLGGIAEYCSHCFVSQTGTLSKMDIRWLKLAAKSKLRLDG